MKSEIIGLVGPIASGKGTVAKMLREKGYIPYSMSGVIRDEVTRRHWKHDRETMQRVGNLLREREGNGTLAHRVIKKMQRDTQEGILPQGANIVIDGIRNPEEMRVLQEELHAHMLGVTADIETRLRFSRARHSATDPLDEAEFRRLDEAEWKGTLGDHGQQVKKCLELCGSHVIYNEGTREDLQRNLESELFSLGVERVYVGKEIAC